MHTVESIIELIKMNKAPFWRLYQMKGISPVQVASSFDEMIDAVPDNERIEKSLALLTSALNLYREQKNIRFLLEMRTKRTGNQGSVFGPLEFVYNPSQEQTQPAQFSGLGSVNPTDLRSMGYIHESMMQVSNLEKQLELQRQQFDFERRFNELEQKNSLVGKLIEQAPSLIGFFLGNKNIPAAQISGTSAQVVDEPEPAKQHDAKYDRVSIIAQAVYQKVDENQLDNLEHLIQRFINKTQNTSNDEFSESASTESNNQPAS